MHIYSSFPYSGMIGYNMLGLKIFHCEIFCRVIVFPFFLILKPENSFGQCRVHLRGGLLKTDHHLVYNYTTKSIQTNRFD